MDIQTLLASCYASVISRLVCYPLDTIAIQHASSTRRPLLSVPLRTYYRGLAPSTALVTPAIALYFTTYRQTKALLMDTPYFGDSTPTYLVAGTVAELASSFVWTPLEVIKSRLQISRTANDGRLFSNLREIWRGEGIRGFYRGYLMGLVVFIPYNGIWWTVYEHTKKAAPNSWGVAGTAALGGCVATITSTCCCHPLDLVKTRYQVATTATVGRVGGERLEDARGVFKVVRNVLGEAKFGRGFYKGLGARLMCSTPSSLISMAVFEYFSPDKTVERSQKGRDPIIKGETFEEKL
ncbi:Mitoferrin-1 [Orbilia brochopaga]|nr:Mitoferrin-1 [Drechslerella brochopaga]